MAKKIKYLLDGERSGSYVRVWKERRDFAVQVWKGKKSPDGEPDGDWLMPGILGASTAVDQAIAQTEKGK